MSSKAILQSPLSRKIARSADDVSIFENQNLLSLQPVHRITLNPKPQLSLLLSWRRWHCSVSQPQTPPFVCRRRSREKSNRKIKSIPFSQSFVGCNRISQSRTIVDWSFCDLYDVKSLRKWEQISINMFTRIEFLLSWSAPYVRKFWKTRCKHPPITSFARMSYWSGWHVPIFARCLSKCLIRKR